ncbi:MAG: hypothetical protein IJJ33_04805 [Victivallales bacterium]|nr:hypothetical protein [Victivallales bacterium]
MSFKPLFLTLLTAIPLFAQEDVRKALSVPLPPSPRTRMLDRTRLYPRIQSKYDLMYNYLDGYTLGSGTFFDRPLFFDRTLAENPLPLYDKLSSPKGFCRDLDSALEFTDGFAIFMATRLPRTVRPIQFATEAGYRGALLLETPPPRLKMTEELMTQLDMALNSEAVLKWQGKVIVSSYHGEVYTPEEWRELLKPYREKYGDKVLFTAELRNCAYRINSSYNKHGGFLTAEEVEEYKARIRSYLEVVDGINFSGSNHLTGREAGYPENVFNAECYARFIVPIFASVLAEPAYNGRKLLGLSAHRGYAQVRHTGSNIDEMCTRGLRQSLQAALSANPDYIIMPEWNELNENTHLQPLVGNAKSTTRVVNAIMGRTTRDVERIYPNIIFSARQENDLSWPVPIELLGLPDAGGGPSQVTLRLLDAQGKLVKAFPPHTFSHRAIEEDFHLEESAPYAGSRILIPELEITWEGRTCVIRDGLPCIRLSTPPVQLQTYVKIPLRDLPAPDCLQASLRIQDGMVTATGRFHFPENLAYLELLANDTPIAALSDKDDYAAPPGKILLCWQRSGPLVSGLNSGDLSITAVKGAIEARTPHVYGMAGMAVPQQTGNTLSGPIGGGSFCRECFFFATPDAVLEVSERGEATTVAVSQVLRHGRYRVVDSHGVSWQLLQMKDLPEMPFPLDRESGDFALAAQLSDRFNAVYCIRAVTREGRVFRTLPMVANGPDGPPVDFPVFDLLKDARAVREIPQSLVRDLRYVFSPEAGTLMLAEDGRREHDAVLGGFDYRTHSAPGWNVLLAPQWRQYGDGKWELVFAKGAGILLGPPVFSRSAFLVEMDVQFDNVEDQTVLAAIGERLTLQVKKGRLLGSITPAAKRLRWTAPKDCRLEAGRFYHLALRYDLETLTCEVDGTSVATLPVTGNIAEGWVLCVGGCAIKPPPAKANVLYRPPQATNTPNEGFRFSGALRSLRVANWPGR